MRVLFVTLFPIENNQSVAISNISLLKGLAEAGHEVILYMPVWAHKTESNISLHELEKLGIKIIRISGSAGMPSIQSKNKCFARLLTAFKTMVKKIIRYNPTNLSYGKANIKELPYSFFDIVISTSDPKLSHRLVVKLKEEGLSWGKWIQHWGDPLFLDITKKYSPEEAEAAKREEAELLRGADKIVYVSPLTYEAQIKLYPEAAAKMVFLPLPYDREIIFPPTQNEKTTLGYFGDYNSAIRNIRPLYDFVKQSPAIRLIIAGGSDLDLKQTENIEIHERLSLEKVQALQAECDYLVSILNLRGTQIPGKIYYDSASNKKIIILLDGDKSAVIKTYFSVYRRYIFADNSAEGIRQMAAALRDQPKQGLSAEPVSAFRHDVIVEEILK